MRSQGFLLDAILPVYVRLKSVQWTPPRYELPEIPGYFTHFYDNNIKCLLIIINSYYKYICLYLWFDV